jgi:hypothetical protein
VMCFNETCVLSTGKWLAIPSSSGCCAVHLYSCMRGHRPGMGIYHKNCRGTAVDFDAIQEISSGHSVLLVTSLEYIGNSFPGVFGHLPNLDAIKVNCACNHATFGVVCE